MLVSDGSNEHIFVGDENDDDAKKTATTYETTSQRLSSKH